MEIIGVGHNWSLFSLNWHEAMMFLSSYSLDVFSIHVAFDYFVILRLIVLDNASHIWFLSDPNV